jgi:DNA-directed RNA polymerase specialized sigma24 family protein
MGSDVIKRLYEADWDTLMPKLLSHARFSIYDPHRLLPGGQSDEDIVHEAVARVITGERNWNPAKEPDLENYLKSVIDSMLSSKGLFGRKEWNAVSNVEDPEQWERMAGTLPNLDGLCHDAEVIIEAMWKELSGDQELSAVFEAVIEGFDKPSEIAEWAGIPVERIYELRRKLERRRSDVLKKLEASNES